MVEDTTLGANIDGQGIMAFADLQADAEDHDRGNANEREDCYNRGGMCGGFS